MYKLIFDAFLGPLQRSHKGQRCIKSGKLLPVTDWVGQVIDNFRNIFGLFAKQAFALVQSINSRQTSTPGAGEHLSDYELCKLYIRGVTNYSFLSFFSLKENN